MEEQIKVVEINRSYERFGWFKLDLVVKVGEEEIRATKQFHTAEERDAVRVGDTIEP